jgi:hypothetical protein
MTDTKDMKLSAVEQTLFQMWEVWIDGRKREDEEDEWEVTKPDPAPSIALNFFRNDRRVSWLLLELMAKCAKEYGYEL